MYELYLQVVRSITGFGMSPNPLVSTRKQRLKGTDRISSLGQGV